jgi:hypothetical protein
MLWYDNFWSVQEAGVNLSPSTVSVTRLNQVFALRGKSSRR